MENIIEATLLGLFFGTFGTTLGGVLGIISKRQSNRFLGFILSLASGLMMSVICFDLIPEALELGSLTSAIIGIILGIISMMFCDYIVGSKMNIIKKNENNLDDINNSLVKTGIIVAIGLAIHNFPEGLAIGSGFDISSSLGIGLAIAICLHDIPEGISMAIPMKKGGMKKIKILKYVILSGVTTGIGAFFGAIIGKISQDIISICLSFAAGAMLYIVSGELIPESNKLHKGRIVAIGNILGILIGLIII